MEVLSNPPAERSVLSGIIRYGADAYYEVNDILDSTSFTIDSNALLWNCLDKALKEDDKRKIDIGTIYAVGETLGYTHILSKRTEAQHLNALISFPVELKNVRKFAGQVRKLQIARQLTSKLEQAKEKLLEITGSEKITDILGIAENVIFDFGASLESQDGPVLMGKDASIYLQNLIDNPRQMVGISSGIEGYDKAIGGGFRKGTVNVIGARSKLGKTQIVDYIGMFTSRNNIPTLNVDTEMSREEHVNRILGATSEVITNDIEKGIIGSPALVKKVKDAAVSIEKVPYYHIPVHGMTVDDIIGVMRRWLIKNVGLDEKGHAKPCLIIYDYLKLMNSEEMKTMGEHQALGYSMMSIHNFAAKYQVPILLFCQLNRDGLTKEDISAFAGSDRISWFCSNLSMAKEKSYEEMAEDGPENGNLKLITLLSRHGEGLAYGDYVNLTFKKKFTKIIPGKTKSETKKISNNTYQVVEDIPFA